MIKNSSWYNEPVAAQGMTQHWQESSFLIYITVYRSAILLHQIFLCS